MTPAGTLQLRPLRPLRRGARAARAPPAPPRARALPHLTHASPRLAPPPPLPHAALPCLRHARRRACAASAAAGASPPEQQPPPLEEALAEPLPLPPPPPQTVPRLLEANAAYCLGCIWLVFLTDMSGIGPLVLASDNVPLSLAILQWVRCTCAHTLFSGPHFAIRAAEALAALPRRAQGAFVVPTVVHSVRAGFDLRATFGLRRCGARQLASASAGGAALWVLLAAATALRGGVTADGAEASYRIVEGAATLWGAPADATGWASLLLLGALAPAAGEELLFRGYLLTALRSRLGRVDAAALAAALFACFHLSFTQFFPTAVLGLAAGAAAVAADSVAPAVALHAAHNAAALLWGAAVCEGALPPGPPPGWAVAAAAALAAAALAAGAADALPGASGEEDDAPGARAD
jgi:membrane protease YdiL (CAAX protease family)